MIIIVIIYISINKKNVLKWKNNFEKLWKKAEYIISKKHDYITVI